MDFRDTPEEVAFRSEVRSWLAHHRTLAPTDGRSVAALHTDEEVVHAKRWSRALADAGFAALTWPREYGGRGAAPSDQAILLEELAAHGAPQHLGVIGLNMIGPTIISVGTEEQRARYLAPLLRAEEVWCQGFSEPDAGSDLAAVGTRAAVDGDELVINGQKVWSSYAHIADYCLLLVRTEPGSTRQQGLTCVIVDMRSAGVEVRPLREMTGEAVFNEMFFSDVRVPVSNVVGRIGDGWNVAMTTLLHERGTLGAALASSLDALLQRLLARAREHALTNPLLIDALADTWIDVQGLKALSRRAIANIDDRGIPGPEGSALKLLWSVQNQRLTKLAYDIAGTSAPITDPLWRFELIRSRANTIEAGTSEVLRSIIAERVLGLPRSR